MTERPTTSTKEPSDELIQLRFVDDQAELGDLNAAELSEVLDGLVQFTSQMARAGLFGESVPPEVRIRPLQEGSFIIEAFTWVADNPEGVVGAVTGAGANLISEAIKAALNKMRGATVEDAEQLPDGRVKLKWSNGSVNWVAESVWMELEREKRQTKRALRKIMAPLGEDANRLEIREGHVGDDSRQLLESAPEFVIDRDDYRVAARDADDEEEWTEVFDAEAQFSSIDFRPDEKWRVQTNMGTLRATIDDDDFIRQLDTDMALHKNDIFDVTIREVNRRRNGRLSREWTLIKITRKRRGDDDHGDGSPHASLE
jgi:hypothetical protein